MIELIFNQGDGVCIIAHENSAVIEAWREVVDSNIQ
jgi:hypothetical protein